ncbi:MAG: HAD-IB family phosphatase [Dehalococcoidia bacterium]|nr:HAD-IB family phosphatase [Dehalococcoidia bacterium]
MKLVAFDLDGTLLWGDSVWEAIARGIGCLERVREMEEQIAPDQIAEVTAAREESAGWYSAYTFDELLVHVATMQVAPGVDEGFALLREHGFKIAVVSLTWEFAVEWFANRFGADYFAGTALTPDGQITHFWPEDKALWLTHLARKLGVDMRDMAAVGDTRGDLPMLLAVGHPYWVAKAVPSELDGKVVHQPDGDMLAVAERIVRAVGG